MRFRTIASGSSGNAYYLGMGEQHFLIDAGISGKRIQNALFDMNVRTLDGIFITHEHRDHIAGAGIVARKFNAPIYATPLTWRFFLRHNTLGRISEEQVKHLEADKPVIIGGVQVSAFEISHDAIQPVGYVFCSATNNEEKIAVATDLGHITDNVKEKLKNAKILLLESNYDPEMLQNGRYHHTLKARVAGKRGHLSNAEAGALLAEVVVPGITHVFLAHLSEENNTPMLAFDTVGRILDTNNIKVKCLEVAERNIPGEMLDYA